MSSLSPETRERRELAAIQAAMFRSIARPLTNRWRMQKQPEDSGEQLIKRNERLSSFERLEIYNRQYWFRLLDCLYDDYPGLLAAVGPRKFLKLATRYLVRYPSDSYALRDLGSQLEKFLREEPEWTAPRQALVLDMVRFEWAQVVAFDAEAKKPLTPDDILDQQAQGLRFGLQPYISLLALDYAVDEFLSALKNNDSDGLRTEASNAMDSAPQPRPTRKKVTRPKREKVWLAVHRHENALYYKRLEPEAFAILSGIAKGLSVEKACLKALTDSPRTGADWPALIKEWFANWSALGWFCPREASTKTSRAGRRPENRY